MSHEAASRPSRLLSLAPELQLHILSWLEYDAPSILSVRLVNRQISTISEGVFAKTFLWSLTVNPFTDDLYRLRRVADHEHFRHHVRALEIQPFRHPDENDPLPKRLGKKVIPGWARVANGFEVDHISPTAQDFLHCLSRLPNCVSFSIRDIDEWGRVVEDDEIPRLAPPTDCLALLIRAAAAPAQPVRIRSLRVVMSGMPEDGCVRPQHLPIELVRSGAFRQNLATNLRTLHLSPFFQHSFSSWQGSSHSEDSYFEALMLIVSAAENLESLVLGSFDERAGRLVRELANMSTFPSRLRHFVLTGGVYHDPEDKRVSTSDLIKVLKRAGAGGKLQYMYLRHIYIDRDIGGWRSVLASIRNGCPGLTNLSIENCGCHHAGSWETMYFCPLYMSICDYHGEAAVTDPCVIGHDGHRFEGEMHSLAVTDEHGGIFEFASMPWTSTAYGPDGSDENRRLHDIGVRYSYGRGADARLDDEGNAVCEMAEAIDAISHLMYLDSPGTIDEDQCKGRHPNLGRATGPVNRCGVGFLPDKDDDSWLDVRRVCTLPGVKIEGRSPVRGTATVNFENTFYMP